MQGKGKIVLKKPAPVPLCPLRLDTFMVRSVTHDTNSVARSHRELQPVTVVLDRVSGAERKLVSIYRTTGMDCDMICDCGKLRHVAV